MKPSRAAEVLGSSMAWTSKRWLPFAAGPLLWGLATLTTLASPPRAGRALLWRWLVTLSDHPVRSSLALGCLTFALMPLRMPERPGRDRDSRFAGLE
jgi:hypothetical protein